jgi:hypothetical protein
MTLKLSHTFMIVDDQDKALAFYRDVLGLELKNDVPLGDERWLTVASPEQPDVEIVLVTASMGHSPQDAEALSACWPRACWAARSSPPTTWPRRSSGSGRRALRCCRSRSTSRTGCATARSATPRATTCGFSQAL